MNQWKQAAILAWRPFWLSRLWVALWVYLGHLNHPYLAPIEGGWHGVENWWLNPWTTYDSLHYLSIAREGYAPNTIAFFPFYPALLQIAPNAIAMTLWGIVLSNGCFALALIVLARLSALDWNERIVRRTLWALAFFPLSVFFSAIYTESVFLLCAVCAFWCARNRQLWWAGFWALCAALTRNSGPLLFVALAALWWQSSRQTPSQVLATDSATEIEPPNALQVLAGRLWLLGAPLLAFLWVQSAHAARFGALSGLEVQHVYFRALSWPWIPIGRDLLNIVQLRTLDLTSLLDFGCVILAPCLVWKFRRHIPISYAIFALGIIAMNLLYARQIPPYTLATTRYLMTTFPFVQLLAAFSVALFDTPRTTRIALGILMALCALQAWQFGLKNFLG